MAVRVDPRADRSRTTALQTARAILVEEGWDALTHARLAERSGLHRATLYRHWSTPAAILRDLLDEEAAVAEFTATGDLRTDLVTALTAVQAALTRRDFGRVLTALIDRGEWDANLHRIKVRITKAGVNPITQLLSRAREDGLLAPGMDPAAAAAQLVGPLLYRRLLSGERITRRFVEDVVDSFLAGNGVRAYMAVPAPEEER